MKKQKFEQRVNQLKIQIETDIIFMFPELEPQERTLLLQQYRKSGRNLYKFFKGLPVERQKEFIEFLNNPEQRNSRKNQKGVAHQSMLDIKKINHSGIHEPAGTDFPEWKINS